MRGVCKRFGATQALEEVSFSVQPGEVRALIGENGAGKSTLMKILSGALPPDAGSMELDGEPFVPADPLHARRRGIAMIYQELTLAPHLSVAENILLGREPSRLGWIRRSEQRDRARRALAELNHRDLPLRAPVGSLTIGDQQIVEIARALIDQPKVLIMDEPTSSLGKADAENLFRVITHLSKRGVSVIYISHFLEECQKVCQHYTVLRDGRSVAEGRMAGTPMREIIHHMVGREVSEIYPRLKHQPGDKLLDVRDLAGVRKPARVGFSLRAGEILGIAGLIGAGRTETLRAIFGLDEIKSGTVIVGLTATTKATPAQRLRQGLGLLSEDRKEEGLMLNRSVADNLTMTRFRDVATLGVINGWKQKRAARVWMEKLQVKAAGPGQDCASLSGGNQQKIALGRLLHHQASVFLLDEPTRGIDVGSKAQIYALMGELATQGKAILFISSYLPELLGVCHRIGVMCRGVLSDVRPVGQWDEHRIIRAAIGRADEEQEMDQEQEVPEERHHE